MELALGALLIVGGGFWVVLGQIDKMRKEIANLMLLASRESVKTAEILSIVSSLREDVYAKKNEEFKKILRDNTF